MYMRKGHFVTKDELSSTPLIINEMKRNVGECLPAKRSRNGLAVRIELPRRGAARLDPKLRVAPVSRSLIPQIRLG